MLALASATVARDFALRSSTQSAAAQPAACRTSVAAGVQGCKSSLAQGSAAAAARRKTSRRRRRLRPRGGILPHGGGGGGGSGGRRRHSGGARLAAPKRRRRRDSRGNMARDDGRLLSRSRRPASSCRTRRRGGAARGRVSDAPAGRRRGGHRIVLLDMARTRTRTSASRALRVVDSPPTAPASSSTLLSTPKCRSFCTRRGDGLTFVFRRS